MRRILISTIVLLLAFGGVQESSIFSLFLHAVFLFLSSLTQSMSYYCFRAMILSIFA